MNVGPKILFVIGTLLFLSGAFLLIQPHLYFCRVINEPVDKQTLYCLINKERHKKGIQLLEPDLRLERAAKLRVFDIVAHNQFSHESISGQTDNVLALQEGYKYQLIGEILARNFNTTREAFKSWMRSASHSAVILNPHYQDIGIAILDSVVVGLEGKEQLPSPVQMLFD